jgi:hypothetical protein
MVTTRWGGWKDVSIIGDLWEMPIYGGKCGVRHRDAMSAERAIGGAEKIIKSRVTPGARPGAEYPTNSPPPLETSARVLLAWLQW